MPFDLRKLQTTIDNPEQKMALVAAFEKLVSDAPKHAQGTAEKQTEALNFFIALMDRLKENRAWEESEATARDDFYKGLDKHYEAFHALVMKVIPPEDQDGQKILQFFIQSSLPEGLVFKRVIADGDCLYNAVGPYLPKHKIGPQILRPAAAHTIRQDATLKGGIEGSLESYCEGIMNGEYGDERVIRALEKAYNVQIIAIEPNGRLVGSANQVLTEGKKTIFILYNAEAQHYDALELKKGADPEAILAQLQSKILSDKKDALSDITEAAPIPTDPALSGSNDANKVQTESSSADEELLKASIAILGNESDGEDVGNDEHENSFFQESIVKPKDTPRAAGEQLDISGLIDKWWDNDLLPAGQNAVSLQEFQGILRDGGLEVLLELRNIISTDVENDPAMPEKILLDKLYAAFEELKDSKIPPDGALAKKILDLLGQKTPAGDNHFDLLAGISFDDQKKQAVLKSISEVAKTILPKYSAIEEQGVLIKPARVKKRFSFDDTRNVKIASARERQRLAAEPDKLTLTIPGIPAVPITPSASTRSVAFMPGYADYVKRLEKISGKAKKGTALITAEAALVHLQAAGKKINDMRDLSSKANGGNADNFKAALVNKFPTKTDALIEGKTGRLEHKMNTALLHKDYNAEVKDSQNTVDLVIKKKDKDGNPQDCIKESFHKTSHVVTVDVFSTENNDLHKAVELALKACPEGGHVTIDDESNPERALKVFLFAKAAGGNDKFRFGTGTTEKVNAYLQKKDPDAEQQGLKALYSKVVAAEGMEIANIRSELPKNKPSGP